MGLEIRLNAELYVSPIFPSDAPLIKKIDSLELDLPEGWVINALRCTPIKWNKDYQIIDWFIEHCDAIFNQEIRVETSDLEHLRDDCEKILQNHDLANSLIPANNSEDGDLYLEYYDEWYFKCIEDTYQDLKKLLADPKIEQWSFSVKIC